MSAAIATVNIASLQEWGNGDSASQVAEPCDCVWFFILIFKKLLGGVLCEEKKKKKAYAWNSRGSCESVFLCIYI